MQLYINTRHMRYYACTRAHINTHKQTKNKTKTCAQALQQ